jgi:hypothetical protein
MEWLIRDAVDLSAAVGALAATVVSVINRHKIQEVHLSINSRMDELLRTTGIAAHADGVEAGRNEAKGTLPPAV